VYAIVRCGGRQEKVALDDVVTVDKLSGQAGESVMLPALLVVDGDRVISDPAEVGRYQVTADIVGDAAGPKINMIQYRNKTGYRRRLGHRQRYTQVRITGIAPGSPEAQPKAAQPKAARTKAAEPKAAEPKAAQPKAAQPKAAEPKAAQPKAAEPKAAQPKAAQPKAAQPKAAEPKAAEPKAAQPRTKAPSKAAAKAEED
jgi:large subunit ribosomal protein L21